MSLVFYQILHVATVILLAGFTFSAVAHPDPKRRKPLLIATGILSLVTLVAAVGALHKAGYGWPLWAILKIVLWLGLSALTGIAFRRPQGGKVLTGILVAIVVGAVLLVYLKPFAS